jgi:hypothetical protein
VSSDRSGANLLHASLAGSGKIRFTWLEVIWINYDDDAQDDLSAVPLLLLWPCMGEWMSESE